MTVAGIEDLPDAHWLHYTMAIASASGNDYDSTGPSHRRVRGRGATTRGTAPGSRRSTPSSRRAMGAIPSRCSTKPCRRPGSRRSNVRTSSCTPRSCATCRPRPIPTPPDAAVQATTAAEFVGVPVAYATLAMSLRETDPGAALLALRRAEDLAEETADTFIIATTSAWGSLATLGLPTDVAAAHLLDRLDRLQSYFGNSEATLLSLCLCVLRRSASSAAGPLHAFLFATPTGASVARSVRSRPSRTGSHGRSAGDARRRDRAHPRRAGRTRRRRRISRRRGRGRAVGRSCARRPRAGSPRRRWRCPSRGTCPGTSAVPPTLRPPAT